MNPVEKLLLEAKQDTERLLEERDWPAALTKNNQRLIANYTAAMAVNFTDWMGKTIPWVHHKKSRAVLTENIRCESVENHVDMLFNFARSCNAYPQEVHHNNVADSLRGIRSLFSEPKLSGLRGLTLMCLLENTSEVFIPVLEKVAMELESNNLIYTRCHGVADVRHSKAFQVALEAEMQMGYGRNEIKNAFTLVQSQVRGLYCDIF